MCVYIYIYIYINEKKDNIYIHMYIYIYLYTVIYPANMNASCYDFLCQLNPRNYKQIYVYIYVDVYVDIYIYILYMKTSCFKVSTQFYDINK
jgi:hypothetical protein